MLFFNTTIDGLQLGLCFAVLALGLYISYSILDFPDLSVDGTFPLGGVVGTIFMYRMGINPVIAIIMSFIVGMLAGFITGFLHVKCKMSKLLAGIIVMTGLLSVTLALTSLLTANKEPTVIFGYIQKNQELKTIFNPEHKEIYHILILIVIVLIAKIIIDLFLKTKLGYMIKATGNNETLVISLGKDAGIYKMAGISIANGFVAASGAIYAQYTLSYDNTCGSGKVVLALASVIIGMAIFSNIKFIKDTTAVIFGAVIYSLCLNYIVLVDMNGIYTKLLNAVLFALILIFNNKISSFFSRKSKYKSSKKYETGEVR
ncbi:MAG: ABC transporter permease [Clostridia bacterium]|nr:ABC transporter permease [Clostridia bacterium]